MKTVEILMFNGVDDLDYCGPLEVFHQAKICGADIEIKLVMWKYPGTVHTASGTAITITDILGQPDILIVPGGGWSCGGGTRDLINNNDFLSDIIAIYSQGAILASVCTGAMILGAAGLLAQKVATTNAQFTSALQTYQATVSQSSVVQSGRIITSGGPINAIPLAVYIVKHYLAPDIMTELYQSLDLRSDFLSSFATN